MVHNNCKVLVVDDDSIAVEVLTAHLESEGFTVVTAHNGVKAWELLTESPHNFSAVIADRMMPVMDGIELTRKIQSQPAFKKLPVIMLTSAAEKEEVIAAVKGGVFDFLMKPIEKDLLLLVIKRAINSRMGF